MSYSGRLVATLCALGAAALFGSCGGGSSPNPIDTNNGGTLNGQVVQGGVIKVTSAAGDGLAGIDVVLISRGNGAVIGRATTDSGGRYQFKELPNGKYFVNIQFDEALDFDLDQTTDAINLFFPVDIAEDIITELTQELAAADTDADGQPDSINVKIRVADDQGNSQETRQQHRRRHGEMRTDRDKDGDFDDSDDSFEDDDNDGLPNDDDYSGPRGPKLKGAIEAISADSITVDGQTFIITDATSFRIRGNRSADSAEFTVGDRVQVTSFLNDAGAAVALEIKIKQDRENANNDEEDEFEFRGVIGEIGDGNITIGGQDFNFDGATRFFLKGNLIGDIRDFAAGDFVEVKAIKVGDAWLITRLRLDDDEDDDNEEFELRGFIQSIDAATVTLRDRSFTFDENTQFLLKDGTAGVLADFTTRSFVEIEAMSDGEGGWIVTKIKLEDHPGDAGDDDDDDDDDNDDGDDDDGDD